MTLLGGAIKSAAETAATKAGQYYKENQPAIDAKAKEVIDEKTKKKNDTIIIIIAIVVIYLLFFRK